MATWTTFDAADMPFIPAASVLLEGLKAPLQGASAAASAASGLLSVVGPLVSASVDPLAAVRDGIDTLIVDLLNTSMSSLIIRPDLYDKPSADTGVDGFLRVVKASFYDDGDVNRPRFGWGADTGGVIFLLSSPDFAGLSNLAVGSSLLFGDVWQDLVDFVQSKDIVTPSASVYEASGTVTAVPEGEDPTKVFADAGQARYPTTPGFDPFKGQVLTVLEGNNAGDSTQIGSYDSTGKVFRLVPGFQYPLTPGVPYLISNRSTASPPDWDTVRVVDRVPAVAQVTELLASLRDAMPVTGARAYTDRLADLLAQKQVAFSALVTQIDEVIAILDSFADLPTVSMLPIPPQPGGDQGFILDAFDAMDPPNISPNDYTMGAVFYGGSAVFNTLGKVFPL